VIAAMSRALLLDREDVALRLAPEVLYPEQVVAPPLADRRRTPGSRRRRARRSSTSSTARCLSRTGT